MHRLVFLGRSLIHRYGSRSGNDLPRPVCHPTDGIATIIFLLSLGLAFRRRRLPYLLISGALAALAARSGEAAFEFAGVISFHLHHTLEHALDGLIAIALFTAIIPMGAPGNHLGGDQWND